jgi:hypothetical protein
MPRRAKPKQTIETLFIGANNEVVRVEREGPPWRLSREAARSLANLILDYMERKGLLTPESLAELLAEAPPTSSEPTKPAAKRTRTKKRDPKKREP